MSYRVLSPCCAASPKSFARRRKLEGGELFFGRKLIERQWHLSCSGVLHPSKCVGNGKDGYETKPVTRESKKDERKPIVQNIESTTRAGWSVSSLKTWIPSRLGKRVTEPHASSTQFRQRNVQVYSIKFFLDKKRKEAAIEFDSGLYHATLWIRLAR